MELIVFAAASLTETLDEIIELYKSVAPNVTIIPTYDSSGTLLDQIEAGADCDLFISAAPTQMNALDALADEENPTARMCWTAPPVWTCWKTRWPWRFLRAIPRASRALISSRNC
ncbi:MAG: substrate-binding domain-containing protein [Dysosmobacter sp.]